MILKEHGGDIFTATRGIPIYGDHLDQSRHQEFCTLFGESHLDLIYCCIFIDRSWWFV
jgi:hypothetical protein